MNPDLQIHSRLYFLWGGVSQHVTLPYNVNDNFYNLLNDIEP